MNKFWKLALSVVLGAAVLTGCNPAAGNAGGGGDGVSCASAAAGVGAVWADGGVIATSVGCELSNVVVLIDGEEIKYEDLSGHSLQLTGEIEAVWIKAGPNFSGDGPGYGEKLTRPAAEAVALATVDSVKTITADRDITSVTTLSADGTATKLIVAEGTRTLAVSTDTSTAVVKLADGNTVTLTATKEATATKR